MTLAKQRIEEISFEVLLVIFRDIFPDGECDMTLPGFEEAFKEEVLGKEEIKIFHQKEIKPEELNDFIAVIHEKLSNQ
ncbi:hypothetical protein HXX01_03545 [Candidatus Nomurabacteria bacterium]|nr:hypothetical protein [Candidatus Nomurabacteria bacterium]